MSSTYGSSAIKPRAIWTGVRARSAASPQACTTSCSLLEAAWSPYCCAVHTGVYELQSRRATLTDVSAMTRPRIATYSPCSVTARGMQRTSCVSTSVSCSRTQPGLSLGAKPKPGGCMLYLIRRIMVVRPACAHSNSDHDRVPGESPTVSFALGGRSPTGSGSAESDRRSTTPS